MSTARWNAGKDQMAGDDSSLIAGWPVLRLAGRGNRSTTFNAAVDCAVTAAECPSSATSAPLVV